MLKRHANLGVECGIPKENTFVVENGDILIRGQFSLEDIVAIDFLDVGAETADICVVPEAVAHFLQLTERIIRCYSAIAKRCKFKHNQYLQFLRRA